uniref:Ground-like domain-containing protein n=1 Tax=Syphacia muris TaxID=451379 RepID=A0A0N5A928_9BILA
MESGQRVDAPSNSQSGEYVEDTSVPEEPSAEPDGGACNNEELRTIVENALRSEADNLEAARQIEGDASKKFGGRFNAIVSDAEFAYVNWYGKMNCQLRVGNRHSLTWED